MPPSSNAFDPPSDVDDLLATVERTLTAHAMLAPGDRVLVGVSGGPDSMVLIHLLSRLAPVLRIRLGVAHLNHCLRGALAEKDAEVVCKAASELGYPCHCGHAKILKVKRQLGLSVEDAARRVRYAFFKKTMIDAGYNKLALGHQMNDNAEQVLLALLRGAGPRGLAGIAPVRDSHIIRPLIDTRRSQIEIFAAKNKITYVTDESNVDRLFLRNRIRQGLLPLLAADYNPRIEAHLNRLADIMRCQEDWIEGVVKIHYKKVSMKSTQGTIDLSVGSLRQAHPALGRRLVRMALEDLAGSLQRVRFSHVQAVLDLATGDKGEKTCHLPGSIRARRSYDRLVLSMATPFRKRRALAGSEKKAAPKTTISGPFPATVEILAMGIGMRFSPSHPGHLPAWNTMNRNRADFDMDRLSLPLTVRPVLAGDRFKPLGAGGSQKIKKFFIDHKLSRHLRAMTAVLADQQRIIWLVGQRIDDQVKVTTKTSKVLSVEFFLLDT